MSEKIEGVNDKFIDDKIEHIEDDVKKVQTKPDLIY